eukprot:5106883-Pyramimonas_sp.AAC.1
MGEGETSDHLSLLALSGGMSALQWADDRRALAVLSNAVLSRTFLAFTRRHLFMLGFCLIA